MADMIKIRSATDATVSLYNSMLPIRKVWNKRGAIVPIEKEKAIQLYYNSSLEKALRAGTLVIDDKEFLYEVGFYTNKEDEANVIELTPALMDKCISTMPVWELEKTLGMLSGNQIVELADYAITNFSKLKMDRIDVLGRASGKNILKAIELYKAAQED